MTTRNRYDHRRAQTRTQQLAHEGTAWLLEAIVGALIYASCVALACWLVP